MTVAPLNTFGTRAVWEWITMIGAQSFTGEVRLTTEPVISLYALRGETYWAEQAGDPSIADRLVSVLHRSNEAPCASATTSTSRACSSATRPSTVTLPRWLSSCCAMTCSSE
jgi:hypothetical protein